VARKLIDTCKEFKLTIDIVRHSRSLLFFFLFVGMCMCMPIARAQEELIAETDTDGSGFIDVRPLPPAASASDLSVRSTRSSA
jgi:hypothetical protein